MEGQDVTTKRLSWCSSWFFAKAVENSELAVSDRFRIKDERERETGRQTETERDTARHRERQRQRDRQRGKL